MTALDVPIVPKHVWEKVGDFSKFNNDKKFPIVGNGPFVITDYKVDQLRQAQGQQGLLARRARSSTSWSSSTTRTTTPPSPPCRRARSSFVQPT